MSLIRNIYMRQNKLHVKICIILIISITRGGIHVILIPALQKCGCIILNSLLKIVNFVDLL
jgi:hypothetical protein